MQDEPVQDDTVQDDADASRWLAEARIAEAARARARERWLRQQAQEGATFAGLALALAEQGCVVTAGLVDGGEHHGRLIEVGEDYVSLSDADATTHLVATHALGWLRPRDQRTPLASDWRRPAGRRSLWDVLAAAVADRPDVAVRAGGTEVFGVLESVGVDVLTVVGADRTPTYLPDWSIDSVSLRSSG